MALGEGLIEKFAFVVGFPQSVLQFDLSFTFTFTFTLILSFIFCLF